MSFDPLIFLWSSKQMAKVSSGKAFTQEKQIHFSSSKTNQRAAISAVGRGSRNRVRFLCSKFISSSLYFKFRGFHAVLFYFWDFHHTTAIFSDWMIRCLVLRSPGSNYGFHTWECVSAFSLAANHILSRERKRPAIVFVVLACTHHESLRFFCFDFFFSPFFISLPDSVPSPVQWINVMISQPSRCKIQLLQHCYDNWN